MYNVKKLILSLLILIPALLFATAKLETHDDALAIFYTIDGDAQEKYNNLVEKKLKSIGYQLTDPHKRVNDQYETKWGSTVLDVLSFMPVVRTHTILPLLNIDPRIAGFAPFNMLIHKKLDENVTHVGHLMPKVMLDILGIENKEVRTKFSAPFKALDSTIAHALGGTKSYRSYTKLPEQTMINFEYEFEMPEDGDIDDFLDEFQNSFELAFIDKGYLIAGFYNFMESTSNAEEILSKYSAFWTYSLCHLEFSYKVFDNEGARPEAGLFAPCTMYMYIRKGTNKVVVGMFRLQNWADTLNITDETRLGLVQRLDNEIPDILTKFGMKATLNVNPLADSATLASKKEPEAKQDKKETTAPVQKIAKTEQPARKDLTPALKKQTTVKKEVTTVSEQTSNTVAAQTIETPETTVKISLPTVPSVPKAISFNSTSVNDRSIKFSKRVPPNYVPHSFDKRQKTKKSTHTRIGQTYSGRISAYLRGKFMDTAAVEEKLKAAGFKHLSSAPVNKKGDLISVVFTNDALVSMASKADRGFMGTLRVLVDTKEKTINITNPLYLAKAFMQNEFDEKSAKKILDTLIIQFPGLKNSKDALKFQILPQYQFMNGMPKYNNMIEVASGSDLLERVKGNKRLVFTQKLENGSTLIGIELRKRTRKFTKRIGRNNAAMLPYPILIENGKAKILDPKYYISLMYPMLKMSEFMTIATVPDAMVKDCEKMFQKKK
ncbi:hypothetical protein [Sulfurovum sp.]|uniref:hypothetical protein n=1 Tax=Sulfurovum sp. TaxID=1969726 RepID=UPI0028683419|nr:hypothetical protein [Sulfurovum sp.]